MSQLVFEDEIVVEKLMIGDISVVDSFDHEDYTEKIICVFAEDSVQNLYEMYFNGDTNRAKECSDMDILIFTNQLMDSTECLVLSIYRVWSLLQQNGLSEYIMKLESFLREIESQVR
jgi:hypothetical protein